MVAFSGDTTIDFIHEPAAADAMRAELLIVECSFIDDSVSVADARKRCVDDQLLDLVPSAPVIAVRIALCRILLSVLVCVCVCTCRLIICGGTACSGHIHLYEIAAEAAAFQHVKGLLLIHFSCR